MEKRALLFLLLSLLGILLLLSLNLILQPKQVIISDINSRLTNQQISLEASISRITKVKASNFQILTLKDKPGNITGILNSNINLNKEINKSKTYIIQGKIIEYNNQLEISINKIKNAI